VFRRPRKGTDTAFASRDIEFSCATRWCVARAVCVASRAGWCRLPPAGRLNT